MGQVSGIGPADYSRFKRIRKQDKVDLKLVTLGATRTSSVQMVRTDGTVRHVRAEESADPRIQELHQQAISRQRDAREGAPAKMKKSVRIGADVKPPEDMPNPTQLGRKTDRLQEELSELKAERRVIQRKMARNEDAFFEVRTGLKEARAQLQDVVVKEEARMAKGESDTASAHDKAMLDRGANVLESGNDLLAASKEVLAAAKERFAEIQARRPAIKPAAVPTEGTRAGGAPAMPSRDNKPSLTPKNEMLAQLRAARQAPNTGEEALAEAAPASPSQYETICFEGNDETQAALVSPSQYETISFEGNDEHTAARTETSKLGEVSNASKIQKFADDFGKQAFGILKELKSIQADKKLALRDKRLQIVDRQGSKVNNDEIQAAQFLLDTLQGFKDQGISEWNYKPAEEGSIKWDRPLVDLVQAFTATERGMDILNSNKQLKKAFGRANLRLSGAADFFDDVANNISPALNGKPFNKSFKKVTRGLAKTQQEKIEKFKNAHPELKGSKESLKKALSYDTIYKYNNIQPNDPGNKMSQEERVADKARQQQEMQAEYDAAMAKVRPLLDAFYTSFGMSFGGKSDDAKVSFMAEILGKKTDDLLCEIDNGLAKANSLLNGMAKQMAGDAEMAKKIFSKSDEFLTSEDIGKDLGKNRTLLNQATKGGKNKEKAHAALKATLKAGVAELRNKNLNKEADELLKKFEANIDPSKPSDWSAGTQVFVELDRLLKS